MDSRDINEPGPPPTSPQDGSYSPARASFQSHSRTMSAATVDTTAAPTRPNRFSLSFPVQPPASSSPTRVPVSPTKEGLPVASETLAAPTGPTDTTFLTLIATQERRVLELKEELQRAESDLVKLKRQWAQHEAGKKRNDARRVTKLQPLHTALTVVDAEDDGDGSSAWMQQEMDRRKALLSGVKNSSRTVFSGSTHVRTLSLLSPPKDEPTLAMGQSRPRKESLSTSSKRNLGNGAHVRPTLLSRASTTPDLTTEVVESVDLDMDLSHQFLDREMLLRTGKKLATELKDGLWTFWDDLRQATVGDEATQVPLPPPLRSPSSMQTIRAAKKQASKSSLRPTSKGSTTNKAKASATRRSPVRMRTSDEHASVLPDLADESFWVQHAARSHQDAVIKSPTSRSHGRSSPKGGPMGSNDDWGNWDESPLRSPTSSFRTSSEANTMPSTMSEPSSPRPSSGMSTKKDPIPWPALGKTGPQSLRRTASHLMQEWEKSLTPSPGKEYKDQEDYMSLGAEAPATKTSDRQD